MKDCEQPTDFPPTDALKGSREKVDVMQRRADLGLPLFHPGDAKGGVWRGDDHIDIGLPINCEDKEERKKEWKRQYMKEYAKREHVKEKARKRLRTYSGEQMQRRREWWKAYRQRPEVIARNKARRKGKIRFSIKGDNEDYQRASAASA